MYVPNDSTTQRIAVGSDVSIAVHHYDEGMIVHPSVVAQFWNVISNDTRTRTALAKQGGKSLADLKATMLRHNTLFLFIYNKNNPGAIIWLNNIQNGTANIHVLGMTSSYGRDMVKLCRIGIGYLFSLCSLTNTTASTTPRPRYRTFIGKIAADNGLAIRLAIRCGLTPVGIVPNYAYDYTSNTLGNAMLLYINNPYTLGGANK